jgi:D-xylose 1-dehydrogenase (NADP+, D-xylono-1,5-lactone-forming)
MSIGWGFIGAGWIAQRAMAPAVHNATGAHLQSVASRDSERSRLLEPRAVHQNYETVIADPEVDVVYICLANHLHAQWAIHALEAGKHVLCEKPLALTFTEAQAMAKAAQAADRLLVEAVWSQWHPRFRRLVDLATGGFLGELREIDTAFTFPAALEGNYRAETAFGGGAWMDVGGYQLHAWLALTGSHDVTLEKVERNRTPSGIDLTTSVTAHIGDATTAIALASFEQPEHQRMIVVGSEATARLEPQAAFTTWREPSSLRMGDMAEEFVSVDAYQLMVESLSNRINGADAWVVPIEQSLAVANVMDRVALG